MAENKTKPTGVDPADYVRAIDNPIRRRDAEFLSGLMSEITGEQPRMWGASIIGFGCYHYRYASGREGDMCLAGFAPRKVETVVYLMGEISGQATLLDDLGTHRLGKACLYIKDLDKVDKAVLRKLIEKSCDALKRKYPVT